MATQTSAYLRRVLLLYLQCLVSTNYTVVTTDRQPFLINWVCSLIDSPTQRKQCCFKFSCDKIIHLKTNNSKVECRKVSVLICNSINSAVKLAVFNLKVQTITISSQINVNMSSLISIPPCPFSLSTACHVVCIQWAHL